jgi:AAA domain
MTSNGSEAIAAEALRQAELLVEHEVALAESGPRLTYRRAGAIAPSRPEWLWSLWLPRGVLVLLVGRQSAGKSTFAAWLVAQLTTGRPFPDGPPRDPMTCALLSLEETAERLVARLHGAHADVERVVILDDVVEIDEQGRELHRPWRLPTDAAVLERRLRELGVGAVAVDGLGYSVSGDSHNYAVIGSALSALAGVAERTGCVVIGLTHPPKGASDPITAAVGSTAWTAIPRITWLVGRDPEDDERRVVRVAKTNYREPEQGVGFTIAEDERWEVGYVTGIEASDVSKEALAAATVPANERTEREEARELLRKLLDAGPMDTTEVTRLANADGLSERTLKRARGDLGVRATPTRDGKGKVTGWTLLLPRKEDQSPPSHPSDPAPTDGPVGTVGTVDMTRGLTHPKRAQGAQSAHRAEETTGDECDEVERLMAAFTTADGEGPVIVEAGQR